MCGKVLFVLVKSHIEILATGMINFVQHTLFNSLDWIALEFCTVVRVGGHSFETVIT